jgi:hypothetical protein
MAGTLRAIVTLTLIGATGKPDLLLFPVFPQLDDVLRTKYNPLGAFHFRKHHQIVVEPTAYRFPLATWKGLSVDDPESPFPEGNRHQLHYI